MAQEPPVSDVDIMLVKKPEYSEIKDIIISILRHSDCMRIRNLKSELEKRNIVVGRKKLSVLLRHLRLDGVILYRRKGICISD